MDKELIKEIEIDWFGLNEANVQIKLKSGTILNGILEVLKKQ